MGMHHCDIGVVVALCLAFFLYVPHLQGKWVNNYDKPIQVTCGKSEFLQTLVSVHSNKHEDRRFYLVCTRLPCTIETATPECGWSNYVNDFDQVVDFQCHDHEYIAGLQSVHKNYFEDRRYNFYCCKMPDTKTSNCSYSGYVNDFDALSGYTVPYGKVLKGIRSYHDNKKEDRRFNYYACDISH